MQFQGESHLLTINSCIKLYTVTTACNIRYIMVGNFYEKKENEKEKITLAK